MGIPEVLREVLVCTVCHGQLDEGADELVCRVCGRHYPIVDGIPNMVVDERSSQTSSEEKAPQ